MSDSEPAHRLPPAQKVPPLLRALDERYGRKQRSGGEEPLAVLIRGVLSQNTSDVNSGRAFRSLRERFANWEELAGATPGQIERVIESAGLAGQKTRTICAVMDRLGERGEYSLEFLRGLGDGEVEARLTEIKGIGIKTARLVLLFGLRRPVFVVDTHVHRVSRRLGLIPPPATRRRAHLLLDELVPDEDKYSAHLNMIEHGRRTCRSQRPLCEGCAVRRWCLYVRGELE